VNATARYNGTTFTSSIQNQRAALGLVNGVVYVPYSGHFGDCGTYHGWVVGVPINNPSRVTAWAPSAIGGGIWGHGGVASDGTNMFVITGNTFNTGGHWGDGEAIIRLRAGPVFSGSPIDYWAPTNWLSLDAETPTWAGAAQCSSMSPARHLRSWRSPWEKTAKPIYVTVIISAVSPRRWRPRMLPIT